MILSVVLCVGLLIPEGNRNVYSGDGHNVYNELCFFKDSDRGNQNAFRWIGIFHCIQCFRDPVECLYI